MTPLTACPHRCCTEPDNAPPHEHRPHPDPLTCPDCAALATPKPLTTGQALEAKARRIAEKKHTRRDP